MVLDAITSAQEFVNVFIGVYVIAIILVVLTSWIRLPYAFDPAQRFLHDICDPYLRLWRRILPSFGAIDISPMVAIVALGIADRIVTSVLGRLH
jgi:YggT family protein